MAEKCQDCGRLLGEGSSSDGFCWRRGDKRCRTLLVANLRSQLRASEAECARLRREVEDVATWLWRQSQLNDTRIREAGYMQEAGVRLRAAVEYLEKERKDG